MRARSAQSSVRPYLFAFLCTIVSGCAPSAAPSDAAEATYGGTELQAPDLTRNVVLGAITNDLAKLVPSVGITYGYFGASLDVSGGTIIVGESGDGPNGTALGSAFVFTGGGALWMQQAKLVAPDAAMGDWFGFDVAISGDTILSSAYLDDDNGMDSGSAYVFIRNAGTWTQQAKILAADGAPGDNFGRSVDLSGDTALIGAYWDDDKGSSSGSAYVFVRNGGTWTQQAKLLAADGSAGDSFGEGCALAGDVAVIGAPSDNSNAGSAYVFTRSGNVWTQQAKLVASDAWPNDEFGYAVAVDGDTILVGAYRHDDKGVDSGAVYVFRDMGGAWQEEAKILATDGTFDDHFGAAVALQGNTAIVGARYDDVPASSSGSAYVFTRSGNTWTEQTKLVAKDASMSDSLGYAVAIDGPALIAGADGDSIFGTSSGSAYVFALSLLTNGAPCAAAGQCQSGFCVDSVCCESACGGDPGDCRACSVAAGSTGDGICSTRPTGAECRAAAGNCDVAETCDGTSTACPPDQLTMAATTCRSAAGACDVEETCSGQSADCPADGVAPVGAPCRLAAGACDVQEACDGVSSSCPADALSQAGTPCRAATGACDPAEACSGGSADCPPDIVSPDGSMCPGGVCQAGMCVNGSGSGGGSGASGSGAGTGGGSGTGGGGGSGNEGAAGSGQGDMTEPSGCGCAVVGSSNPSSFGGAAFGLLLLLSAQNRPRSRSRSRSPWAKAQEHADEHSESGRSP